MTVTPGGPILSTWRTEGLVYRYPRTADPAVDGATLEVRAAECTAIIGPNGSGKSTLFRLLLGVLTPERGTVWLEDRQLSRWSRPDVARRIGVVAQGEETAFPLTVREMVGMGRYPYLGSWRRERTADRSAIDRAMERCDVIHLAGRPLSTLSGGERQRTRVARALAQEPGILALDEPTVALDIGHEMTIFELLRDLRSAGVTVLLITHNLNLAARYADRLVLMHEGRISSDGAPGVVLQRGSLERVYRWPLLTTAHPGPGADAGAPQVTPLSVVTPWPVPDSRSSTFNLQEPT